jgi:acetyl-CoA C-acetyltransferase
MKAVMMGAQAIKLVMPKSYCRRNGKHEFDSHYMHMRNGTKFGPATMVDGLQKDGLDAYDNAMGLR